MDIVLDNPALTADLERHFQQNLQSMEEAFGSKAISVVGGQITRRNDGVCVIRLTVVNKDRPERDDQPRESVYDAAVRLGFVGEDDGLPSDLSTNPAHMEGFGR